jgi:thiosulfate reductase cytochrome b subunit
MTPPCLHPLPLRIWHWLNAFIVFGLLGTGLYLRLHVMAALHPRDPALLLHKGLGLAMIATTLFWLVYAFGSGSRRRHYGIGKGDLGGMAAQARYYLFSIFIGEDSPFHATAAAKYNPLQKIAYDTVMLVFLPLQAVTGLLFMNVGPLRDCLLAGDLVGPLGALHVLCSYLLVLYLVVHLYMSTLGETFFSHTRAMIFGGVEKGEKGKEA